MNTPLIPLSLASSDEEPALFAVICHTGEIRETPRHHHARGQLLGAEHGLLTVDADDYRWVVPATHAAWIPPAVPHGLNSHGPYSGWNVYISAHACKELPDQPCILSITGLLREAVTRASAWKENILTASQIRLAGVILDEIQSLPLVNLGLPIPQDARLIRIARALSERPDDDRSLEAWAEWAGISPRTLSRRFSTETGFSFTEWRQRVRLLRALELLAEGKPVKTIALELGYGNVSTFIALFRRVFGMTPGQYKS